MGDLPPVLPLSVTVIWNWVVHEPVTVAEHGGADSYALRSCSTASELQRERDERAHCDQGEPEHHAETLTGQPVIEIPGSATTAFPPGSHAATVAPG